MTSKRARRRSGDDTKTKKQKHENESMAKPVKVRSKALFQNHDILELILRHLSLDDIQIFRLVCRNWNAVCKTLPVELSVSDASEIGILNTFPKATSLKLCRIGLDPFDSEALAKPSFRSKSPKPEIQQRRIPKNNVTHLSVAFLGKWQASRLLRPWLAHFSQLTTLHFVILNNPHFDSRGFYTALQELSQLTDLDFDLPRKYLEGVRPIHLEKLEKLNVHTQPLIDSLGNWLFPSIRHLTELSFVVTTRTAPVYETFSYQILEPYVSTLKALRVGGHRSVVSRLSCLFDHRELDRLTTFDLQSDVFGFALFKRLAKMRNLTELGVSNQVWWCFLTQRKEFPFPELKALSILPSEFYLGAREFRFSLPQLTKLVYTKRETAVLDLPDSLLELTLDFCRSLKLNAILSHVPKLVKLEIFGNYFGSHIQSKALTHLKSLRDLTLKSETVGEMIFSTLAEMAYLTGLVFDVPDPFEILSVSELRLMSNLVKLDFRLDGYGDKLSELFPKGSFPQLRSLKLTGLELFEDEKNALMTRIPNLRRISFCDKPWNCGN